MSVAFLTPLAAFVGLFALVPVGAVALRERRYARVRARFGLHEPCPRGPRPVTIALAAVFALLALAAAQPVLREVAPVPARTDAEAYVLVDVSRSMLAAPGPAAETRFERAVRLGLELGRALSEVPVGVASLTDRPLPHLFPTIDRAALEAVLTRSLGIGRPPPSSEGALATELGSLVALANDNYFSAQSAHRLVVLLTDGESRPFDPDRLAAALRRGGVELVVLRLRSPSERVYGPDGRAETGYVPDGSMDAALAKLAARTPGGTVFSEAELPEAIAAARRALGEGPVVEAVERRRTEPLGAWIALAAALPLAVCLGPPRRLAYCMLAACRGSSTTVARRSRRARARRPRSSYAPRSSTGGSSPGGA